MTDIDAIRNPHRWITRDHGVAVVSSASFDALLAAFDAKCEELAEARSEISNHVAREELGAQDYVKVRAERDAAVRDAQRMDWVERFMHRAGWDNEGERQVIRAEDGAEFTGDSFREAIDAALAPPTEQTTEQTKVKT